MAHSFWLPRDEAMAFRLKVTAKQKRGVQFKSERLTAGEIETTADDISAVVYDLTSFMFNLAIPYYPPGVADSWA